MHKKDDNNTYYIPDDDDDDDMTNILNFNVLETIEINGVQSNAN